MVVIKVLGCFLFFNLHLQHHLWTGTVWTVQQCNKTYTLTEWTGNTDILYFITQFQLKFAVFDQGCWHAVRHGLMLLTPGRMLALTSWPLTCGGLIRDG